MGAVRRHTFRFFKGSGPVAEPPAPPGPDPASAPPAQAEPLPSPPTGDAGASPAAPVPAPAPPAAASPGAPDSPPAEESPYMAALREALATDSRAAWEAFNAESSRLEAQERELFKSSMKDLPAAPPAPSRREVPPAPERRLLYASPLARASREAYGAAPAEIREALDGLFSVPGVHRLARNAWSGSVGAWTRDGEPSPAGNAYLAAHGELVPWTLSLKAASYMPRDAGAQWFAPGELEALGAAPAQLSSEGPEGSVRGGG